MRVKINLVSFALVFLMLFCKNDSTNQGVEENTSNTNQSAEEAAASLLAKESIGCKYCAWNVENAELVSGANVPLKLGNMYYALRKNSSQQMLYTSSDGTTWNLFSSLNGPSTLSATFDRKSFTVDSNGVGHLIIKDGNDLYHIAFNEGTAQLNTIAEEIADVSNMVVHMSNPTLIVQRQSETPQWAKFDGTSWQFNELQFEVEDSIPMLWVDGAGKASVFVELQANAFRNKTFLVYREARNWESEAIVEDGTFVSVITAIEVLDKEDPILVLRKGPDDEVVRIFSKKAEGWSGIDLPISEADFVDAYGLPSGATALIVSGETGPENLSVPEAY